VSLTLRWTRVEPGLWAAGPYVLKRAARGGWRVLKNEVPWKWGVGSLPIAKDLCANDYTTTNAMMP
jgi:hypothetical protein